MMKIIENKTCKIYGEAPPWLECQTTMNENTHRVLVKLDNETRDKAKTQARLLGVRLSEHYRQALTTGLNEFQNADALERIKNIPA
jgi:hypothetical protein